MRHELFERTMKQNDFSPSSVRANIQAIVRQNAEGLIASNVTSLEAEQELLRFVPQLQKFARDFTSFGAQSATGGALLEAHGMGAVHKFLARSVEAVEETIASPELGLKGTVDMILRASVRPSPAPGTACSDVQDSLVGVELKTGHNQHTQNAHAAQLALYIIMLQAQYGYGRGNGAMEDAILLYMNSEAVRAIHFAPRLGDIKSLIGQRNVLAIESRKTTVPRGISLTYETEGTEDEPQMK
jgi:DNA replication factor Dna2